MTQAPPVPLYADIGSILDDGIPEPPRPEAGTRTDGNGLLYFGAVNVLFGPPESGKTLAASCIAADALFLDQKVLILDLDHNGVAATIARFRAFGVKDDILRNPNLFRYASPEEQQPLLAIVNDCVTQWQPDIVLLDSIGELLPLFGANSNDADDFTRVNRATMARLATAGACVIAIDHEAKGTDSRAYGTAGTMAKKRALDGAMLRFTVKQTFAPGHGGKAAMTIAKDRHGGLRATSPVGDKEPLAAMFLLTPHGDALTWTFAAPRPTDSADAPNLDLQVLLNLVPRPRNIRDIKERLKWGTNRAQAAWNAYGQAVPRS